MPQNLRSSSDSKQSGAATDPNFVNDDWDEGDEDSPVKSRAMMKKKSDVVTGSRADHDWLEADFDD